MPEPQDTILDLYGGAVCASCGVALVTDGPLGWVHQVDSSMYGVDGHLVSPITRAAYEARNRE